MLDSSEYKAVKELGQTPLLLTLLCAVYDESQSLPKRRSALYGEALEVWLKKWASERRVHRDPIYQELNLQLEQVLLSEIAYQSFAEDQLFFSKRDLTDQIRAFLVGNLNAPKHLDAEQVLYAIQVQQGILVERASGTYSFSHLTFQEYLTAQYIVDEQQLETLVTNHLVDRRWREVFLLVAGLSRSADDLLKFMEKAIQRILNSDKSKALLSSVKVVTENSGNDYTPVAKRAFTLSIVLAPSPSNPFEKNRLSEAAFNLVRHTDTVLANALDAYALHVVKNLEEIAQLGIFNRSDFSTMVHKLENLRKQLPTRKSELLGMHKVTIDQFFDIWCTAFKLDYEWLKLSKEERWLLENYLYANELMIRCKEAALRVSPQVWDAIESRMLTIQD